MDEKKGNLRGVEGEGDPRKKERETKAGNDGASPHETRTRTPRHAGTQDKTATNAAVTNDRGTRRKNDAGRTSGAPDNALAETHDGERARHATGDHALPTLHESDDGNARENPPGRPPPQRPRTTRGHSACHAHESPCQGWPKDTAKRRSVAEGLYLAIHGRIMTKPARHETAWHRLQWVRPGRWPYHGHALRRAT